MIEFANEGGEGVADSRKRFVTVGDESAEIAFAPYEHWRAKDRVFVSHESIIVTNGHNGREAMFKFSDIARICCFLSLGLSEIELRQLVSLRDSINAIKENPAPTS